MFFAAGWQVNGWRWEAKHESLRNEYAQFQSGVAAAGERAAAIAAQTAQKTNKAKERTDAENRRTIANLHSDITRLRDNLNTGRGGLSSPAPAASGANRVCFDAAEFGRALRSLDEEVLGIVEEGSKAVANLNSARLWAQDQNLTGAP